MTLTIQKRLAFGCAAATAIVVGIISVLGYIAVRDQLRQQIDSQLRTRAQGVAAVVALPRPPSDRPRPLAIPSAPPGRAAGYVQFVTPEGTVLPLPGASRALRVDGAVRAVAAGRRAAMLRDETLEGQHLRVLTVPVRSGGAVQVALPLTDVDSLLARLRIAIGLIGLAGVLLAGLLVALVARAGLASVRRLRRAAQEVAHTRDLSRRISVERRDEVGALASTFNEVLAALQLAHDSQRQLVTDASHELRTPLTALRTNLEVLCDEVDIDPAMRGKLVEDLRSQVADLSAVVDDVVSLARNAERQHDFDDVRLDDVVADAVVRASRNAPSATFRVDRSPTLVRGRAGGLGRAVDNLLSNAAKWSPPGSGVDVSVRCGEVVVADHGPGIPGEDLPRIFDRFYRSPHARSSPGSGLGLAIVRKVVEEHGGSVTAECGDDGGTVMRMTIPESKSLPADAPHSQGTQSAASATDTP